MGINIAFALLSIAMGLTMLITIIIVLLPLAIFKMAIGMHLKTKYKKDFGGLLENIDNVWAIENENSRHIINAIMFIEYNCSQEEIMPLIHEVFSQELVYQFTCVRRKKYGYYFRLLNQTTVQDLISKWELSDEALCHKEMFDEALTTVSNKPMPLDDTACFQLLASTKPVSFTTTNNNNTSRRVYPLLLRIHHSVGDGVALLSFLLKNVSDEKVNVEEEIVKRLMKENVKKRKDVAHYVNSAIKGFKKLCDISIYYLAPVEKCDRNALHGPELSGNQILTSHIEECPVYVNKIKSIKNRIPGCSFSDVVLTAISASFYEHFRFHTDMIPKNICLSFILKRFDKGIEHKVTNDGKKEYELGNHFSMGMFRLPIEIDVRNPERALQERLQKIKEESEKIRNSADVLVYYWQLRYFTNLLPAPVLRYLISLNDTATTSLSNLPGIESVHIRGHKVKDIVFWVPAVRSIGIGLSVLTYDNRLQMGFLGDEVLITEHKRAQSLLDNVIKHIDKIDDELKATL